MDPNRPPDAVRTPLSYAGAGDAFARLSRLHEEFRGVLRAPRLYVRHQGHEHFLSARADDTLGNDQWHERPGEPRYTWEDRGDGVMYGWLCHDPDTR